MQQPARLALFVVLSLLFRPMPAACDLPPFLPDKTLASYGADFTLRLETNQSIGGPNDTSKLADSFRRLEAAIEADGAKHKTSTNKVAAMKTLRGLTLLREHADSLAEANRALDPHAAEWYAKISQQLTEAYQRAELGFSSGSGIGTVRWQPSKKPFQFEVLGLDFGAYLQAGLNEATAERAAKVLGHCEEMLRLTTYARLALSRSTDERLKGFAEDLTHLNKQWDLFREYMKPEWPWETTWNDLRFRGGRREDTFNAPPLSQVIWLHPGAFFEVSGFSEGDLRPAVGVELLGWNQLAYKNGSVSKWPLGISVAATYSMAEIEGDNWGIGVLAHVKGSITAGVIWSDRKNGDDFIPVIGADLAGAFNKYRERWEKAESNLR
jgi:hypothetical protein